MVFISRRQLQLHSSLAVSRFSSAHVAVFPRFFAFHVVEAICHRSAAIYRSRLLRIMAASTRVTLSCSINKRGAGAPVASLYTERSYLLLLKTLVLHQMQMGVSVWAAESEIWSWNTGELGLAGSWQLGQTCSALILGKFQPDLGSLIYDCLNSFPWAVPLCATCNCPFLKISGIESECINFAFLSLLYLQVWKQCEDIETILR